MTMIDTAPSRRSVLAGLGGLTFCIAVGNDGVRLMSQAQANALANASVTPWVRIAPDGRITILSAGAEMGQGSMTSLPLIVAEEMDADWSKVAIEWTPADAKVYGYKDPFGTEQLMWIVGSRAVQLYFTQLRMAGAQVRKVLIANAAQKWGVDAATLKTEPSVVINPANGARMSYGEIAALANGLAVVADHFAAAKAGRDALKVTWRKAKAEGFNSDRALEDYVKVHADPNAQAVKLEQKGDITAAFASAAKTYHAEFRSDYAYHAQMEPLNAVVRINEAGDRVEVWEGSQAPDESRKAVAKALSLPLEQVDFHQCY